MPYPLSYGLGPYSGHFNSQALPSQDLVPHSSCPPASRVNRCLGSKKFRVRSPETQEETCSPQDCPEGLSSPPLHFFLFPSFPPLSPHISPSLCYVLLSYLIVSFNKLALLWPKHPLSFPTSPLRPRTEAERVLSLQALFFSGKIVFDIWF